MITREAPFAHACDPMNGASSRHLCAGHLGLIEILDPYLNFVELPAFRLDEGCNCFRGKERLRASRTFGERLEALLGIGIDANEQGCGHMGWPI